MLKLNNVEVIYNDVILVLKGLSMELPIGKVFSLLGGNGAGKTTVLRSISGLLKTELGEVTDGSVEFEGVRIDKRNPEQIVRMGIVQVLEGRKLFDHLTVEENLKVSAVGVGRGEQKKDLVVVQNHFPKLVRLKDRTAGYLSGGEQQMLVIGSALMCHPKIMLLDEPSLGLAPLLVKEIFEIIKRINTEENLTILLVEQNVKAALGISEYGYIMENGRIVLDGPAEKLQENEDVKEFYLGLSTLGDRKSYREVKHYRRRKRWLS
ncbi:MAG: ABC transporter ATP-binding protein [Desulfobacterales bacterium]|nr:ABC transporter ATP-binding protein [Desulfobacterales bacterium]